MEKENKCKICGEEHTYRQCPKMEKENKTHCHKCMNFIDECECLEENNSPQDFGAEKDKNVCRSEDTPNLSEKKVEGTWREPVNNMLLFNGGMYPEEEVKEFIRGVERIIIERKSRRLQLIELGKLAGDELI